MAHVKPDPVFLSHISCFPIYARPRPTSGALISMTYFPRLPDILLSRIRGKQPLLYLMFRKSLITLLRDTCAEISQMMNGGKQMKRLGSMISCVVLPLAF